jgi:hypothetical protein
MKNLYYLRTLSFLLCLALFIQCSNTRIVNINTMRPAEITFPSYVNTLLLLDRTQFKSKAVKVIESIITGELPGEDKAGLQETMRSFQQTLMSSPRFKVKNATEILAGNSLTSTLPAPIAWEQVEELCQKYGTEAIVSIEIYDTDFIITNGTRKAKKQVDGKETEVEEIYAQGVGNITIGFRLYDPKAKTIIDEQLLSRTNTWQAAGTTVRDAIAHLILRSEATKAVSRMAGADYAYKIAPMPVRLSRVFYSKGKKAPQVAAGSRLADVNDWKTAISTWESGLSNAHNKDAGRICYDIAIAYEMLGDLDKAKTWAKRS